MHCSNILVTNWNLRIFHSCMGIIILVKIIKNIWLSHSSDFQAWRDDLLEKLGKIFLALW